MRIVFAACILGASLASSVLAEGGAVPTAPVEYREVDLIYSAEAVVEAIRQATIVAQVQGRVVEVRCDVADPVEQGALLMRIDERETTHAVAGSDAQVDQAQANLDNAKATYARTKNLLAQKFVSQAALDQAEAAYRAAEAQLKAAFAARGQTGTTQSFTAVTSPLTGVVAQRHTELGEMASPGKPLMTVFDPKGLRVVASVPQHKLAEVAKARRAKVEFPETGRWVDAVSVILLPITDARTHTAHARLVLPEAIAGIVPGMFARAHFAVGRARKLVVPQAAILHRGEVTGVYVIDAQGSARLRQVRLGEFVSEGMIEVLAGLSAGERVALDPVKAGVTSRR